MDEQQELDLDLNLNDDPFNPKKDKSGIIKGILIAVAAIAVIAFYFFLTKGQ